MTYIYRLLKCIDTHTHTHIYTAKCVGGTRGLWRTKRTRHECSLLLNIPSFRKRKEKCRLGYCHAASSTFQIWNNWPILKIFGTKVTPLKVAPTPYFQFPTISNDNVADPTYCEAEATPTPLTLTLNLLRTTIVAPPSNASKWKMGFNSAFKWLKFQYDVWRLWINQENKIFVE